MQNNPYPPQQPSDPSGQPYPPAQQPFPGQQPYPGQQSYPPYGGYAQQQPQPYYPQQPQPYYPQQPQQPYYPPQPQQVYYPPQQQPNPNQTTVVVNTSQKVNTGCAPWVIWLCIGVALLLCSIVAFPVIGAVFMANTARTAANSSSSTDNANTYTGSQHHKMGEVVTITAENASYTMVVNSAQVAKDDATGTSYFVVDLTATNSGSTTVSPLFPEFHLADAANHIYTDGGRLYMPSGKHLFGGDIQPGGKINGTLVFEIQLGQHSFTLTYDANSLGSTGNTYGWDLQV